MHSSRAHGTGSATGEAEVLQTFVIVHDEDALLALEQEGRFGDLAPRYVFVGPEPVGSLHGREDVVVARSLPDNIEHYPDLLSFTAWYAISRNGLASEQSVALLEYDSTTHPRFREDTLAALRHSRSILGYVPYALSSPLYMYGTPWLTQSLAAVYGIDLRALMKNYLANNGPNLWAASTNLSMRVSDLHGFVEWFLPLTEVFRHDPIGAHVHERAIPVYCLLNGIEIRCQSGLLEHEQLLSHGIAATPMSEARRRARESAPLTEQVYRSAKRIAQRLNRR